MMKKVAFILWCLLLTGGVASGSGGGGSSGGSGSSGGGGGFDRSANYDIGRAVFFSKLHCDACPLSGMELGSRSAASILPRLASDGDLGKSLSYRERYAVRYYLKKRFDQ